MRNILILILLGSFFSVDVWSQSNNLPFTQQNKKDKTTELNPNLDITLGYVPKSEINAIKTSFSANNIIFNRFGVYTSIEKGLDSDYFSHTLGITGSILPKVYLWGGLDLFTKRGFFNNGTGARKELGIGFFPCKRAVIQLGYSSSIGPTFAAGFRIPIR